MKTCIDCGQEKELREFYRHPMMADGFLNTCKRCKCAYQERRRQELINDPEWRAKEAERHRQKAKRRPCKSRPLSRDRMTEEHLVKERARTAFKRAVRRGEIVRPTHCENCGEEGRIQGHHDDYTRPFDVRWLCIACHGKEHRKF